MTLALLALGTGVSGALFVKAVCVIVKWDGLFSKPNRATMQG